MKSHLRQLGNSKAVLLTSVVLVESGLTDEIEISVEPGRITITPATPKRDGWFPPKAASRSAIVDQDPLSALDENGIDIEEWEW